MPFSQGAQNLVTRDFPRGSRLNWLPTPSANVDTNYAIDTWGYITVSGRSTCYDIMKANKYFNGKLYFEFYIEGGVLNGDYMVVGFANEESPYTGITSDRSGFVSNNDYSCLAGDSLFANYDLVGFAVETATGKLWWHRNGSWQSGYDPANWDGTGNAFTHSVKGPITPVFGGWSANTYTAQLRTVRAQTEYCPEGFTMIGEA